MSSVTHKIIKTSQGPLLIAATAEGLIACSFISPGQSKIFQALTKDFQKQDDKKAAQKVIKDATAKIKNYFSGDIRALENAKLSLGGTPFQKKVWKALLKVRAGKTLSYGDLAKKIGTPKAARAVGSACRDNPLCLFVPCHRIVGNDGDLTGYNGGLEKKVFLLRHEGTLIL
jgi:methylated-DNA-[protein]-cysteine S-methyltransferase